MQDNSALGRALALVRDLRQRCPWDRVQTRETIRPYLLEEVFELDHAIAEGNAEAIREEVSDLLLHLSWQLVLGEERGEFTADEVASDLELKMRRRHPQLFDLGPAERWESLKRRERTGGVLDGLPPALPSLLLAYRLQQRAASIGFDWPDTEGPRTKVREELAEVELALHQADAEAITDEIGDLLFAVVNLSRKAQVEPGGALDRANRKFRDRFRQVEELARMRGIDMATAGLQLLDSLWDEVKRRGPSDSR